MKNALIILFFIFFILFTLNSQNTYDWSDLTTTAVFFEIPGGTGNNTHQVQLDLEVSGLTSNTKLYITYPDGTSDILAGISGSTLTTTKNYYNTDVDIPSGKHIFITENASGDYSLYIAQNYETPDGFDSSAYNPSGAGNTLGEFAENEIWGLTFTYLSSTSTVHA